MSDPGVDARTVIEVLREVGPHGVKDHPDTQEVDVFTFFEGRDLRRSDLTGISMALSISFAGADLRQANLRGLHLHDANLRGADLRGADLRAARVRANFDGARIDGLLLDGSDLSGCRFVDEAPDLARCSSLDACEFVNANLGYTRLLGRSCASDFRDCDLTGLVADDIAISRTWTTCEMSGLFLTRARADAWLLVECHGDDVGLPGAGLDSVELIDCRLPGLDAEGADLSRSIIVGTDLAGASLRGATLTGADLERVSLAGADLRGAELSGASFGDVDLTDALLDPGAMDSVGSREPSDG